MARNDQSDLETLQKAVEKVLDTEVTIKQLKTIIGIMSILESAGLDFDEDIINKIETLMATTQMVSPSEAYEYPFRIGLSHSVSPSEAYNSTFDISKHLTISSKQIQASIESVKKIMLSKSRAKVE
ncbi:MAG: hypothetical protein ACYSUK_12450 [Planctomycetota bacterium]|jgi:hypothetical protein